MANNDFPEQIVQADPRMPLGALLTQVATGLTDTSTTTADLTINAEWGGVPVAFDIKITMRRLEVH